MRLHNCSALNAQFYIHVFILYNINFHNFFIIIIKATADFQKHTSMHSLSRDFIEGDRLTAYKVVVDDDDDDHTLANFRAAYDTYAYAGKRTYVRCRT